MDNNKEQKRIQEQNNVFGGFRYRSSYDDCRKELAQRLLRQGRRGLRTFVLTATAVSAFCAASLMTVMLYRSVQERSTGVPAAPTLSNVSPSDIYERTDEVRDVGGFVVRNLEQKHAAIYHIPQGVVVTYVNPRNARYFREEDIIISVGGNDTPSVASFAAALAACDKEQEQEFYIYREGEYIGVNYVLH